MSDMAPYPYYLYGAIALGAIGPNDLLYLCPKRISHPLTTRCSYESLWDFISFQCIEIWHQNGSSSTILGDIDMKAFIT